jgi:hypothetical protein
MIADIEIYNNNEYERDSTIIKRIAVLKIQVLMSLMQDVTFFIYLNYALISNLWNGKTRKYIM